MPLPRPSARAGAAGAALLAASALALAGAPAAPAHGHLTPLVKTNPLQGVTWAGIDRTGPNSFCERYPTACELTYEEPRLVRIPDPGPYRFEHLVIPVAQLDLGHLDLVEGELAGVALGGR